MSARLETLVKERNDKVTGKGRAVTADEYASLTFGLQPRRGAESAAIWGPDAKIVVRLRFMQCCQCDSRLRDSLLQVLFRSEGLSCMAHAGDGCGRLATSHACWRTPGSPNAAML